MEYLPEIYVLISFIGFNICLMIFYFQKRKNKNKE